MQERISSAREASRHVYYFLVVVGSGNGTKRRDSKQINAPNRDENPARSERHAMSLWRLALELWPRLVGVNNACVAFSLRAVPWRMCAVQSAKGAHFLDTSHQAMLHG